MPLFISYLPCLPQDGSISGYQHPYSATFIRPIRWVQEIEGSSISPLHMTFARTNQFIVILFGCAVVFFLALLAVSASHRFLESSKNAFAIDDDEDYGGASEDHYYKQSEVLIQNHVENLNKALISTTRLNEHRLRKRMQRFAERFRHDLVSLF